MSMTQRKKRPTREATLASEMAGNAADAARVLKALSNKTRLLLLCGLIDGEKSVNELAELVGMRLPAVSQHLAKLRANGLVSSRRDAQTIIYFTNDGLANIIVNALRAYYRDPTRPGSR